MDTKILEYIIAIADEKSVSRAAEKFLLSPSALSQHLKKIEMGLGANLFTRLDGDLCLTDAGKIYINGARSILYIQNEAMVKINSMCVNNTGIIRFMTDERTAGQVRKYILPVIREKMPFIEVKLIIGYQDIAMEYILNGMADIGVVTCAQNQHDRLELCTLHTDELVLVLPISNKLIPLFERGRISWEMMASDYFIFNKTDDGIRKLQQEIMDRHHFHPQILCEVDTLHAARHMAENGLGSTILPLSFLKNSRPSYRIFHFDPPEFIYTSAVYSRLTTYNKPIKDILSILKDNVQHFRYYGKNTEIMTFEQSNQSKKR